MKALAATLLVLALAAPGAAQAPTTPQEEAEHDALRRLRVVYENAVNEEKLDLLAPHLHPDFTGVMITGETVAGLDGLKQYWARMKELMGEGGTYTVSVEAEWSTIVGDVAMGRGTTRDVVVTDRGEYRFGSAWTAVLRKVDGEWKVLRIQGSMDPVTNPFVTTFMKRTAWASGGGGAAAGIALGLVGGLVLARRRKAAV